MNTRHNPMSKLLYTNKWNVIPSLNIDMVPNGVSCPASWLTGKHCTHTALQHLLKGHFVFVLIFLPFKNEQTYESTVIWLRIMNRQVAHIQTIAVTEAGMMVHTSPDKVQDKLRTKFRQSQIQPSFKDLAPGWKQPSPDNKVLAVKIYWPQFLILKLFLVQWCWK